ncbi:hypothetical protein [Sulfitobacter sp. SK011]|uniref:hypothetical protein n=1 Tax=Sulfitobacter sp. SK011 TaxID=1389004 RepID=UPI0013B44583
MGQLFEPPNVTVTHRIPNGFEECDGVIIFRQGGSFFRDIWLPASKQIPADDVHKDIGDLIQGNPVGLVLRRVDNQASRDQYRYR